MRVDIVSERLELVDAAALLLPVDGQLCRLGGAATGAIRATLDPEERAEELEYLEEELARLRPLAHPQARMIGGVGRWESIIVSAAYPHNVDGAIHAPSDCARMVRAAIPQALACAGTAGITSIAAALIGTAYRMTAEQAVRAFVDGLAAARASDVTVRWSLPDEEHRALARSACQLVGLPI